MEGWSEYLATKILSALEAVLKAGETMNTEMQDAYDKACEAAKGFEGFAAEHPVATAVFCTVIAIGILMVLAPYAVELLGFGELGLVEGESCVFFDFFSDLMRSYTNRSLCMV